MNSSDKKTNIKNLGLVEQISDTDLVLVSVNGKARRALASLLKGQKGDEVELRITDTHIQWRLTNGDWDNLISYDELRGPLNAAADAAIKATGKANIAAKTATESAGLANIATETSKNATIDAIAATEMAAAAAASIGEAKTAATDAAKLATDAATAVDTATGACEAATTLANDAAKLAVDNSELASTAAEEADTATIAAIAAAKAAIDASESTSGALGALTEHTKNIDIHKTSQQIRGEIVDANIPMTLARVTDVDNKDAATLQAAKNYAAAKIAEIVNSSPGTLDTLSELAAALGNDPNFATSIMALIGGKADRAHGHAISEVTNLQSELNGKAKKNGDDTESFTADAFFANKLNKSFNRPQSSGIEMLSANVPEVEGAPGQFYSALSVLSLYVGFQLATYGGTTEDLRFRKRSDANSNVWTPWRDIWHSGNLTPANFLQKEGSQKINGNLTLNTPTASYVYFDRNEEHKGYVGCGTSASSDVYLTNMVSNAHIRVADDGKNYSNDKEIATTDQLDLKANTNHNHDNAYAPKTHSHSYAAVSHSHPASQVTEETNKRFMTDAERTKLTGIAAGANAYTHPNDTSTRHVTDLEKATWNGKAEGNHTHAGIVKLYSRYRVTGASNGATPTKLAGEGIIGVNRLSQGCYKIFHILNSASYVVILNGTKATNNNPVFATISEQAAGSFVVTTADDNSPNDSIFEFTILTY